MRQPDHHQPSTVNARSPTAPFDAATVDAVLVAGRQVADLLCDRWTLLILLSAHAGMSRFSDFRDRWGMSTRLLGARLEVLEAQDVLVRLAYSRRPLRFGYHLTPMGTALFEVFATMWRWERDHTPADQSVGLRLQHLGCAQQGQDVAAECAQCGGELLAHEVEITVDPAAIPERPARSTTYRRSAPREGSAATAIAIPLPRVLAIFGDKWTNEIVMCAFVRVSAFGDLQAHTGMSSNILSDRLARLMEAGILQQERGTEDARRLHYKLTDSGRALFPILLSLWEWADRWIRDRVRAPIELLHHRCGHAARARVVCRACHQRLAGSDLRLDLEPPAALPGAGPRSATG